MTRVARRFGACCFGLLVAAGASAAAVAVQPESETVYKRGAWHYRSVPCAETTVRSVNPRLEGATVAQSGVSVTFNTHLGLAPVFASEFASVTHYQDMADNALMAKERRGDRVQVCFVGWPAPTQFCDPDKDSRGRLYRVYDYRRHASYSGINSEHDCGGA